MKKDQWESWADGNPQRWGEKARQVCQQDWMKNGTHLVVQLGKMAHLLLARSAQSLPLAQPESRLYLLAAVPAEPLLGAFPGMAGWAPAAEGNPVVAGPSFTTSPLLPKSYPTTLPPLHPPIHSFSLASVSSPGMHCTSSHPRLIPSPFVPVFLGTPLQLQPVHLP